MNSKRNVFILALSIALTMALSTFAQAFTYKDRVREPAMRTVMERINDEISSTAYNTTGKIFYVDSGIGSDSASGTKEAPFATIDYAIGKCTASNGDIIFIYPGHAETLAAAQITADIAGVSIIALGNGANRATITMSNSASSIDVTAANVTIRGLRLYSTTANTLIGIDLAAGADNCILDRIEFTDTGGFEFTVSVDLKTGADNVTISNSEFISASAGATASINVTTGVVDRLKILGNRFWTDASTAVINSDQINTDMLIEGNLVTNNGAGAYAVKLTGAATGELVNNALYTNAWATMLDPGSLKCFGNVGAITVDTDAIAVPLGDYLAGGGTAPGQKLPASTSIYDVLGSFTGPYGGAAQDDNIKASLDLINTDTDTIITAVGTTIPGTITTAQNDLDTLTGADGANLLSATQTQVDGIETAVGTTIPGTITTLQADATELHHIAWAQMAYQMGSVEGSAQGMPAAFWWVDGNITASGAGTSPAAAFKTIQEAIAACSNTVDDWVFVFDLSGSGATTITMDKSFVHLIGNSTNGAMAYPRIFPSTAVAGITFAATGDRVEIANFVIGGGDQTVPAISFPVATAAGAYGVNIHDNVIGRDATAPCLEGIYVAAGGAAPYLVVKNNRFYGSDGAGIAAAGSAIRIAGNATHCNISNNFIQDVGRTATPAIWLDGAVTNPQIENNRIKTDTDTGTGSAITLGASVDDGWIAGNWASDGKDAPVNNPFVDAASTNGWAENYSGIVAVLP